MKKYLLLSFSLLFLIFPVLFAKSKAKAAPDIEVTVNSSEHTVVFPFEKSFRLIATIKNNSMDEKRVRVNPPDKEPEGGHILAPVGYYDLAPDEETRYVAVVEFSTNPDNTENQSFTFPLGFEWDGGSKSFNISVDTSTQDASSQENQKNTVNTTYKVLNKETKKIIKQVFIVTNIQSGLEQRSETCQQTDKGCTFSRLSGDFLKDLAEQYSIDHKYPGYILQIGSPGYKSYFNPNFLPEDNGTKTIYLEPLKRVGDYKLAKTIDTDFSIWWIKASDDEKYFAFSQGTHGSPEIQSPEKTVVTMADSDGNVLWQNETAGECWGLDISPDGNYVAAGCHKGDIYVWDKKGDLYFKHQNPNTTVRWVKFSPKSTYLVAGPTNNIAENAGLFDIKTKQLLFEVDIGSYLREARFADDESVMYLASANGQLFAIDIAMGNELWAASGDYYIPFILGFSEDENTIITAGKGRIFVATDLTNGLRKWETAVDQTITAGEVAENSTVTGSTVGGMAYGLNSDGSIGWARQYGGVGHNAVYYTRNGRYALFGGPNPTLFDSDGNILWQREANKEIQMTGPVEIDSGAAYVTWASSNADLLILGGDDGNIDFYKGEVKEGNNNYSQYTVVGPRLNITTTGGPSEIGGISNNLLIIAIGIGSLILIGGAIIIFVILKKKDVLK